MGYEQENAPLQALSPGDRFSGYYLLKTVQSATSAAGKPYLSLRLADRSGELPGKVWDYGGPVGVADAGQIVWVSGRVERYQNAPQSVLDAIRRAEEGEDYDPARLVPTAPHDPARMLSYVEGMLDKLGDGDYRAVCLAVLDRSREAFAALPGAKSMHHGFLHGLLMHTANMMRQADCLAKIYPEVIDRSLLLAGAFLHDIGKLAEFDTTPLGLVSEYSREGRLLGHIFLGAELVGTVGRELCVPEEKLLLLQHLIAAHHGRPEYGTIVPPRCAEAELLANIDMIDSRMEIFRETYAQTEPGQFSRQRVYAQNNDFLYRPSGRETE